MDKQRECLMERISEVSFVMDDLRLFLDTHPCDQDALCMYREYSMMRAELVAQYTSMYGPMSSYGICECAEWNWTQYPWPWEGVC